MQLPAQRRLRFCRILGNPAAVMVNAGLASADTCAQPGNLPVFANGKTVIGDNSPGRGKDGLRYLEYEFLRGFGSECEP